MSQADEFHNLDTPMGGIQRELAPGLNAHIFVGDGAMLSVVTIAPNAVGTLHSHPEEQWGVLLEGAAVRVQGGEEIPVRKGDFWRTPGGAPHSLRAGPEGARVLDIFSPPRGVPRRRQGIREGLRRGAQPAGATPWTMNLTEDVVGPQVT